jgi:hypothetical protein
MTAKLPAGTLEKLWADPSNWRGGVIYVCKEDPRFIVPRRWKWGGWTLNFAHASAWTALAVVALVIVVPGYHFVMAGLIGTWIWWVFLAGMVVILCAASAVLASPGRYEEAA